ncbi:hypothetical protein ACN9MD_09745 [Stenotrophomonas maltophilia]|uniref:hypothetical protein n=1 Tax=Stenotrophomonas maltophilia TaxID=40324 RepID=UPI003CEAF342
MNDQAEFEIARGERANQLLSDPLLVEAFEIVEQELTSQWQNSPVRDAEGREKLFLTLRCLQKARAHLTSVLETGVMAKATLVQRAGQTLSSYFSR